MRITSITFRANGPATGTPFSHVHVEASAVLGSSDRPSESLEKLKEWVHTELLKAQQNRKAIEEAITIDEKIGKIEHELQVLRTMRDSRARRIRG